MALGIQPWAHAAKSTARTNCVNVKKTQSSMRVDLICVLWCRHALNFMIHPEESEVWLPVLCRGRSKDVLLPPGAGAGKDIREQGIT